LPAGARRTLNSTLLDRGLRRNFFDLYVMLQQHGLGIGAVLTAIRTVYGGRIDDTLMPGRSAGRR